VDPIIVTVVPDTLHMPVLSVPDYTCLVTTQTGAVYECEIGTVQVPPALGTLHVPPYEDAAVWPMPGKATRARPVLPVCAKVSLRRKTTERLPIGIHDIQTRSEI
jgi:hypothetical protein